MVRGLFWLRRIYMRRYIGVIGIMVLLLSVGLSAFFFISQQKVEIARLEEVIQVMNRSNDKLTQAKEQYNQELDTIKKKQRELYEQLDRVKQDYKEAQAVFQKMDAEEKALQDEIDQYMKKLNIDESSMYYYGGGTDIIKAEDIQVGDIIDGKKIVAIEDNGRELIFKFEGYYLLRGELVTTEMGPAIMNLLPYDAEQVNKIFGPAIDFGDTMLSFGGPGIRDSEKLKEELGERIYGGIEESFSRNAVMKVPVIAVFKDYLDGAWRESERVNCTELVEILEISTPEYLLEK